MLSRTVLLLTLAVATSSAPINDNPLLLVPIPQPFADSYGAACLDQSPPIHYTLRQDPSRWIIL